MTIFQTILTSLYPPRCLSCGVTVESEFSLCGTCWGQTRFIGPTHCAKCSVPLPGIDRGDDLICDECLQFPKPWAQCRAAVIYEETGRQLVLGLKHGDRQDIAKPAAAWMWQAVKDVLPKDTLIAPVPLHWMRLAQRRYNQSALLAQAMARLSGFGGCPDLLQRTRSTPSLDGKNRTERMNCLTGAIRLNPRRRHIIENRPILLVDDVMTTGTTLGHCAEICRAGGAAEIYVSILARAVRDA